MRRYVERHVQPCAVIVYERVSDGRADFEDEKYRIHYTVASSPFREKYFSSVSAAGEFSSGSDIYRVHGSWNIGSVIDSELAVERNDSEAWRFRCELFTNGYKIFQFVLGEIS